MCVEEETFEFSGIKVNRHSTICQRLVAQRQFFCYTFARQTAAKTSERNEQAGEITLLMWVLWAYAGASRTFLRH